MIITNWHRLFGIAMTDYFSETSYSVELEKDLSLKKQLLDVVVIEKKEGNPPTELADGLENMAPHNLVSYKSLHEPFDEWAADELVGHYVNYRKQISPAFNLLLPEQDFGLYAVCTRFPRKLDRKRSLHEIKNGVYAVRWGSRNIRIIVTGHISNAKRNALWLLFSAVAEKITYGVSQYQGKLSEMSSTINQLLTNYLDERIIAMPYTLEDYREELKRNVLSSMTTEELIEKLTVQDRLKGLSAQDRLKGLSAHELLKVISADELLKELTIQDRLKGLSLEEIEAYLAQARKKRGN